jgi:hypothetical protein
MALAQKTYHRQLDSIPFSNDYFLNIANDLLGKAQNNRHVTSRGTGWQPPVGAARAVNAPI